MSVPLFNAVDKAYGLTTTTKKPVELALGLDVQDMAGSCWRARGPADQWIYRLQVTWEWVECTAEDGKSLIQDTNARSNSHETKSIALQILVQAGEHPPSSGRHVAVGQE